MKRRPILLAGVLAALAAPAGPGQGANLTPPNLGGATTLADQDLFVVWPDASNGPLESIRWSALRAQLATALGSTWLLPANNLSELTNITTARTNLGLGTAATANTGSSGATVPLLNGAASWSATQTFTASLASGVAEPVDLQNTAADAPGDAVGLDLLPSASGCRAIVGGYRDGAATNTGLQLWPCAAGSRMVRLQLSSTGALQLSGYLAGLAQFNAAGALSSSYTVANTLTLSVPSNTNGLTLTNSSLGKAFVLYPLTNGTDTDAIFWADTGNTYAGTVLKLSGADGSVTVTNNLTAGGNTTLGAGASNTVTVQGANLARPNMPAFSAKLSAALTAVTGDATTYTVAFNTTIFDRHGDFNTSTGAFTVPFTGLYQCSVRLTITNVAADNNRFQLQMFGTGIGSNNSVVDFGKLGFDSNGRAGVAFSDLVSLIAGNTLTVRLDVEGHSSKNIGILNDGGVASTAPASTFSCYLAG
jgi:hypothetical protein